MTKTVKRHLKRTGKKSSRENATGGIHGRSSTGLDQGNPRNGIAESKCVRIAGLLFLPLVFGIFGMIMFPPSFDINTDSGSNTSNLTDNKTSKPKAGVSQKTTNYQPTILDSLNIQEAAVDNRNVNYVELTKELPDSLVRVYQYDGFLSDAECDGLMRVHKQHIAQMEEQDPIVCFDSIDTLRKHLLSAGKHIAVSSNDFTQGTSCLNVTFSSEIKPYLTWSYSTAFYPQESKFSTKFANRVFEATGLKQSNGGKFQITSYPEGIGYKTHTDCVLGDSEKRDRFGTILVYLQDVEEGGETKFPELGISVKPKKGRAIVWNNMNSSGACEPVSVHEAAPVVKGHKYIIQRWYYYESFEHLGKRSKEPSLPPREPHQARVSCDEYEHGSCRWYDEWNYEHLLDYRAVKKGLS